MRFLVILGFVFTSFSLFSQGLTAEEEKLFIELSNTIDKDLAITNDYYNRAVLNAKKADTIAAISDYSKAIELNSDQEDVFNSFINRGALYQKQKNFQLALNDYNSALEIQPKSALAMNNRGFLKQEQQLYSAAIADFDLAISFDQKHERAYVNKLNILQLLGKTKEAKAVCDALILALPNDERSYITRADFFVSTGDLYAALLDWNRAEEFAISNPDFYIERSKFKDDILNDNKGAVEDCQKAIETNPLNAYYYFMQSRPQFDLQAFYLVLKNCTKAIELDPKLGDAYVMRANVEDMFGMTQEAIKDYETAISINPTDLDAYNQLIITLGVQGSYEEALITANRFLTQSPNHYEMLSNRVKIYLGLNKMIEAFNDLKTLQTIEPKNSFGYYLSGYLNDSIGEREIACQEMLKADRLNSIQAHNFLYEKCPELIDPTSLKLEKLFYDALALEDQLKLKEAILKYDELVVLAPDSALFYYNRGKVKRTLELHKEAIVDYNSAIQLFPNEVTFWVSRAVSELYSKDTIACINTLKKAIEINPSYPMSYFNLGSVLFEKKHYEDAIPFLELAIFYQSFYPKAHMCLGECYVQLKNYSSACEVYKRAEEIGINEAFAKRVKVCNFK